MFYTAFEYSKEKDFLTFVYGGIPTAEIDNFSQTAWNPLYLQTQFVGIDIVSYGRFSLVCVEDNHSFHISQANGENIPYFLEPKEYSQLLSLLFDLDLICDDCQDSFSLNSILDLEDDLEELLTA